MRALLSCKRRSRPDIDEAEAVLVAHQPRDALRFGREALRADCAAVGRVHFRFEFLRHMRAQLETVGDRALQMVLRVHRIEHRGLTLIERRLVHRFERDIRDIACAMERQRQCIRESDRRRLPSQCRRQPRHKARTVVLLALSRLAAFDAVLRFEVAAREIVSARERNECDLFIFIHRRNRLVQRRCEGPVRIKRNCTRRIGRVRFCDRDIRP